jgi:hypothetical protein
MLIGGTGGIASLFANRVIPLPQPFDGLVNIVNVFNPVGPGQINAPEDVKVVQNLLHAIALSQAGRAGITAPQVTGRFDAPTGFWIFYLQSTLRTGGAGVVDGIVSPARGGAFFGATPFFIVHLNAAAYRANRSTFERFMNACLTGTGGGEFGI